MIIGIDIGGSTTKIVGFIENKIVDLITVKANDQVASASGALGKFINTNKLSLSSIKQIIITGVGASFIQNDLFGIATSKVDEFKAIGLGGSFLSGLHKTIVVSIGTGTAIVKVNGKDIFHLGGTGIGGGTLLGLSKCILNTSEVNSIIELAKTGSLNNIDLTIGDISKSSIGILPDHVTASNFGKLKDQASRSDYAAGIINLVFQTIGMFSIFAARIQDDKDIVLTGQLVNFPQARAIFDDLSNLFHVNFHFPEHAEYATAIGAAISSPE
jgi:type II pantothenate kinase